MAALSRTPTFFSWASAVRSLTLGGRERERESRSWVPFECSQGTYLNCFTLSVSVTYCTSDRLLVRSFRHFSFFLRQSFSAETRDFSSPPSVACLLLRVALLARSYIPTPSVFKRCLNCSVRSESHAAYLPRPLRLRLARSHADATLSCCLMSLCERNSSVSLTCFHLHMLPLLVFWLPSMPAHTDSKEKFCSLPFQYHSFYPVPTLWGD